MDISPDLEGFRQASATMRAKLGEDIPFFTPTTTTWDPSVPIDPETGEPYDPTIAPTASGWASAVVRASIVYRPLGMSRRGVEQDIRATAVGRLESGDIVLIVDPDEYEAELTEATEAEVHGERYELGQVDYDQMGDGPPHRVLIYGEQK